jgi:hypothetical protein
MREKLHFLKLMVIGNPENKESRRYTLIAIAFCLMCIGIGLYFYFTGKGLG